MGDQPLTALKGVGPKRAELFAKLGVVNLSDMLSLLPRDYQDFSSIQPCAALQEGQGAALLRLAAQPRVAYPRRGLSIVSATGHDETGRVGLVWYNQPYMKNSLEAGAVYLVYGKIESAGKTLRFVNPSLEPAENLADGGRGFGILPVYPLVAGLNQKAVRNAAKEALERCLPLKENLPETLRLDYELCERNFALQNAHFPKDMSSLAAARRRLAMEEVFFFLLAIRLLGRERRAQKGISYRTEGLLEEFLRLVPFAPTGAQMRAMEEIAADMGNASPMNRLIQGDVGAGKTIPAFFALYVAACNNHQGVLMAPTEILARQHYENASRILGQEGSVALLVGGMPAKARRRLLERIAAGEVQIVIGTHALLQGDVQFASLGLVVTDEQHRFGVRQRAAMKQKAEEPDVLVMSATPIPRTLSLILFGDLDASVIDELPPGRKTVLTRTVPVHKRMDMYGYVRERARGGEQTYIVCPLVEESELMEAKSVEELYQELIEGPLRDVRVELLHGRLNAEEKESVLERFRRGETAVLISTTVIEVGVDVPNATTMIIENAERFGLAQLHQLRGRVGRGDKQSYCFLLTGTDHPEAVDRLRILCSTSDGFEIARQDLELRGPGEFLGSRQSGQADYALLRCVDSMEMLQQAQEMAERALEDERYRGERGALLQEVDALYRTRYRDIALN